VTARPLQFSLRLSSLTRVDDILAAACRELLAQTGAERVFASCCMPGQRWEQGTHVECASGHAHKAVAAAGSALFAIRRRLASQREMIEVTRGDETSAIFAGLGCGDDVDTIHALPITNRTGQLWGELVVPAPRDVKLDPVTTLPSEISVALENAQRLAFARRDQDRLLLLAEATDDALYDWDFQTHDFWWGGGIIKLYGPGDPVENSQRWKLDRIHPEDAARVHASFDAARASTTMTWAAEYRFQHRDGSFVHVEDRGYFLRDAQGRAYRMIGSMRDVTAMKALLAREQQARSEAESASRAKDEFLAILGHELRNPLAPIVTGLELIRLRGLSDTKRELVVLERQSQHLVRLVDDLLDISRIAHGKVELKQERLDIASVISAAIETSRPLIVARAHALESRVAPGLHVLGDRARLAQAIANLVNNAAKYTEPGGRIDVIAERRADTIAIVVRDNGIGISPEMLPHVFNMFVQERQALDRAQGGLGLGLSIVRSLIGLHDGTVEAHSAGPGQGSDFTICLPAAPALPRTGTPPGPVPRLRAVMRRKIMVVDDNEDAADLLASLLERLGNRVRVAHDADEALRIADEFEPDLAVLDIGLPMIDGYELARRLRERYAGRGLQLVALTGYGTAADKERATQAGFDAHLVKPVAIGALAAVIEKLGS
jgi:signal transduction histidine kinase